MSPLAARFARGSTNLHDWFLQERFRYSPLGSSSTSVRLRYVISPLHGKDEPPLLLAFWLQNKTRTVNNLQNYPTRFQHERHKLLGRGLWRLLSCSARVPQGPDGAAAHDGAARAGIGPVLRRPPLAAAALPPRPLHPDLVGPLQQHALVIVDGPQGGTGQRTVWLCAGVKMRVELGEEEVGHVEALEGLLIDDVCRPDDKRPHLTVRLSYEWKHAAGQRETKKQRRQKSPRPFPIYSKRGCRREATISTFITSSFL